MSDLKRKRGDATELSAGRISARAVSSKSSGRSIRDRMKRSSPRRAANPGRESRYNVDVGLALHDTHVLVTGGCGLIGRVVVKAFLAADSVVTIIDIESELPLELRDNPDVFYHKADISKVAEFDAAFTAAEKHFRGVPEVCVALASLDLSVLPQSDSFADADPTVWQRVFDVNLNGTFITAQRWMKSIRAAAERWEKREQLANVSLILMGSESGSFGVRTMPAYAAAKAAIQVGLLKSLAQDLPRIYPGARVNAVAPGPVATERLEEEKVKYGDEWYWRECEATIPTHEAVSPESVAKTILYLASGNVSENVNGQLIPIDGGKQGNLIWTRNEVEIDRTRFQPK